MTIENRLAENTAARHTFIDTHCHFDFPLFGENELASLRLASEAGIERIIIPAVESCRFERVLSLARRHSSLYAALGLHPLYISHHRDADLELLAAQLRQKPAKMVAVGEIGLDLYMQEPQFERQYHLLEAQLRLAKQYDLPVILHSRRSHDRLAQLLRRVEVPRTGVIHGFAGSLEQAQAFVRLGYYIGVGGTITYPRANKSRQAIARLPLSCLLLETDAPDMPVYGYQGEPNRPERVTAVFQSLCQLRPEPAADIATAVYRNTLRLFGLPQYG
ncbi:MULTISPECIES: TatD family hydrolase [unclassified Brenneria]|uniref:TatD family hydrolase n=1 Tax=unclassified Brenneria TaxID=2634434 RepID=UPI001553274C|nr:MULTISPECIES: TatD family hydrolase [unclassified Brenneria]MBJ7222336.1 TatD family hydrolase [Brenneria sp. L3-3C-1]MEE3643579.1 TatD family hydrolase [Brenneria sp. L3_3C_1]MEE3651289.1 TatD family hydrolase [Brenneria sp. HEZEL_4_2_4]NPD01244.1 metal-dependent hydrolase [Brenneria sp. hezel4-2-4]